MRIKIKNHEYAVIEWIDENRELRIRFATEDSLATLAEVFDGENEISIIGEDETATGYWYSNRLINLANQGNGIYEVKLSGSLLDSNAEGRLADSIDDTEGAIFELADLIATVESAQSDSEMFLKQYKERVEETIHSFDEKDGRTNERFNEHTGNLNDLQERITELRHELVGIQEAIAMIPKNIDARMISMEESYNRLADRVARLENRG